MRLSQESELMRVTCEAPHVLPRKGDVPSGKAAEAGTFWAFVWPKLVWSSEVTWLFPFVSNEKNRSNWMIGNLWGVDAEGKLLVIRTKQKEKSHNPFSDFLNHQIPSVNEIQEHWQESFEQERNFVKRHAKALYEGHLSLENEYPGIVPYSKQRMEVRRWRHLYRDYVEPMISGDYADRVEVNFRRYEQNVRTRKTREKDGVQYITLFTLFDEDRPMLAPEAFASYRKVVDQVGKNNIRLVSVQRFPPAGYYPETCEVVSRLVQPPALT